MRIEQYRQHPAGGEERNFTRLLQGGFRTITGLIGKRRPEAYRVDTPVATIGVRGTHYEAVLDGGLQIGAYAGEVVVGSAGGRILLGPEQPFRFARIEAAGRAPVGLLRPPPALERDSGFRVGTQGAGPRDGRSEPERAPPRGTGTDAVASESADEGPVRRARQALLPPPAAPENLALVPAPDAPARLPVADLRFTPEEWSRLWSENRFGVVLWERAVPTLTGGRAIEDALGDRPVITSTGDPPFAPEVSAAPLRHVFRRGAASLLAAQTLPVDAVHQVRWGAWDGEADPVRDQIDPLDPARYLPIREEVLWATVLPTRPETLAARTDSVRLDSVAGALLSTPQGVVAAADVMVSMDVDFAAGRIANGSLYISAADFWSVDFEGEIRGSFADLRLLPSSRVSGNPVEGVMGGVFTGRDGQALLQAFDLRDALDPTRWAQGMVLVK